MLRRGYYGRERSEVGGGRGGDPGRASLRDYTPERLAYRFAVNSLAGVWRDGATVEELCAWSRQLNGVPIPADDLRRALDAMVRRGEAELLAGGTHRLVVVA